MVAEVRVGSRTASVPGFLTLPRLFAGLDQAALCAALAAFGLNAFGVLPVQLAVAHQLNLGAAQTSSWLFVIWISGALTSLFLALTSRQPLNVMASTSCLIYLGTFAGRLSGPELLGANLLAGLLLLVLGTLGITSRLLLWIPLPIVMGVFAGSVLAYLTQLVHATVADTVVAGATVIGYLAGRALGNSRVPPVGLAMVLGSIAVVLGPHPAIAPLALAMPTLRVPASEPTLSAFLAVSLPMVILANGLGNAPGFGILRAQGYRVPLRRVTVVSALTSVVNALFGGYPAALSRDVVAILASPDAGPVRDRYWAALITTLLMAVLALAASSVVTLVAALPPTYIVAMAGLATLAPLQSALEKAFGGNLRFGALVAFGVAVTPFTAFGITSACWALLAGILASWVAERTELQAYCWRGGTGELVAASGGERRNGGAAGGD